MVLLTLTMSFLSSSCAQMRKLRKKMRVTSTTMKMVVLS
jgi:hypothetical protein